MNPTSGGRQGIYEVGRKSRIRYRLSHFSRVEDEAPALLVEDLAHLDALDRQAWGTLLPWAAHEYEPDAAPRLGVEALPAAEILAHLLELSECRCLVSL